MINSNPSSLGHNQLQIDNGFDAFIDERGSDQSSLFRAIFGKELTINGNNIADIAHFLTSIYGRYPSIIDIAEKKMTDNVLRHWVLTAMEGFAREREFITRISILAPPTVGVEQSDPAYIAVHEHRRAVEMLAQSDRRGCAIGAAMTLVADWWSIRQLLDMIAKRLDMKIPACTLPDIDSTSHIYDGMSIDPKTARAMRFGATQLLLQHISLWNIVAIRHQIRTKNEEI